MRSSALAPLSGSGFCSFLRLQVSPCNASSSSMPSPVPPLPFPPAMPAPHQQQSASASSVQRSSSPAASSSAIPTPSSSPAVVRPLTREVLARRLHSAFANTETWTVPEHVWAAFFCDRGVQPALHAAVRLELNPEKPDKALVSCPLCASIHWASSSWLVSHLLDHLKSRHSLTQQASSPTAAGRKRAADGDAVARQDEWWQRARQRSVRLSSGLPSPVANQRGATSSQPPAASLSVSSSPASSAPASSAPPSSSSPALPSQERS